MAQLSGGGVGIRFLMALAIVFTTFNPSGYSYFHWFRSVLTNFETITPYIVIAGIALVIGWVIYIRATLRSLGVVGIALVGGVSTCILWILFEWELLSFDNKRAIVWMILLLIACGLTVGMCWSHIRRILSGQVDSDDVSED